MAKRKKRYGTIDEESRAAAVMLFDAQRKSYEKCGKVEIIKIRTQVPMKWRFVDLETGDIWQWMEIDGGFIRSDIPKWF